MRHSGCVILGSEIITCAHSLLNSIGTILSRKRVLTRRPNMGVVNPLTMEQAAPEAKEVFEKLAERSGKVPNMFAAMAHRPDTLRTVLPLYKTIINQGTVEPKYKELAYLRASMVNGCEYCTRAHSASSKRAGVTAEQIAALPFYN